MVRPAAIRCDQCGRSGPFGTKALAAKVARVAVALFACVGLVAVAGFITVAIYAPRKKEPPATAEPKAATSLPPRPEPRRPQNEPRPETPKPKRWWEMGTPLHQATLGQWREADYLSKLSTAADWALRLEGIEAQVKASGTMETAKRFAGELVTCIDGADKGRALAPDSEVSQLAVSCIVLMGWE